MELPPSVLVAGRPVAIRLLSGGELLCGRVMLVTGGWLQLSGSEGPLLVRLDQIAVLHLDGAALAADEPVDDPAVLLRPRSAEPPRKAGSKAPGRAWHEEDLRALADAFLDNANDAELAERFHRARGQVKELRQGFECARGNLVEDQISPVAQTWVGRWRKVLGGVR